MNERICELWSKAGGSFDQGNQHTWPQYTIDEPEKFVELVIQKLSGELTREAFTYKNSDREQEYMQGMLDSASFIKRYFEVAS